MSRRKAKLPADKVHLQLMVREGLREKLEAEAVKNQNTLNNEMRERLEQSLRNDTMKSIEQAANHLIKRMQAAR
jgi:hypothetical protein